MTDTKRLLARIGTVRDAISRKEEQTSLDYLTEGVLMECAVALKEQNLTNISTADLIRELAKREGVERTIVEPHQEYELPIIEGPALIFVIPD